MSYTHQCLPPTSIIKCSDATRFLENAQLVNPDKPEAVRLQSSLEFERRSASSVDSTDLLAPIIHHSAEAARRYTQTQAVN